MLRSAVLAVVVLVVAACSAGTVPPTAAPTSGPTTPPTAAPTAGGTSIATPTVAPTQAPPTNGAQPTPSGEVCGVDWFTSPGECGGEIGERFVFQCPPAGRPTAIYGTDTYTDDSGACVAAVHVGLITFESGGTVTVELRPGLSAYVGSTRNGIDSYDWNSWPVSFVFVGGATAVATDSPFGTPSPELAPLLAHVPAAFNVNCHEVTTFSAGEVIAASCSPDFVSGYVTYILFDTDDNATAKWFGDYDYFAEGVSGSNCSSGPCLVAWERDGVAEGRYFANNYTGIDPNGLIAYWFDSGLRIEAGLAVYDTTFAEMYDLALQAGPTP